ncbi:MAG: hypothetical protein Q4F18_15495, partial [Clostridia bacterium]|nr:hypothetical protein [Clostridia bacterium]
KTGQRAQKHFEVLKRFGSGSAHGALFCVSIVSESRHFVGILSDHLARKEKIEYNSFIGCPGAIQPNLSNTISAHYINLKNSQKFSKKVKSFPILSVYKV